jgi:glutamate N-acetyltransferase / amino-acid N-acetyltransferase
MNQSGPIFLPLGFKFSALTAGIKASRKPDLALILAPPGTTAAALFTTNLVQAAPVQASRQALARSRGRIRAVIVNSGNANCATGAAGLRACNSVCQKAAQILNIRASEVFPSSTGVIGVPLPSQKIKAKLPALISAAAASANHLRSFADAILTTDSRAKLASLPLQNGRASITGIAKGSGMIHPQLATMLVYLLTDVSASPMELKAALRKACADTFNAISVDGDTSTNDTVLLLASGESGVAFRSVRSQFETALLEVCRSLAEQIVADGEGVQHVILLSIEQAMTRAEALQVARTIAHSLLVKTAWAGADPNWGRILAAVGRSGIKVDPGRVSVLIGGQVVCRNGVACKFDEQRAHQELSKAESRIIVRLGRGKSSVEFLTTDLTAEYVRINAEYST